MQKQKPSGAEVVYPPTKKQLPDSGEVWVCQHCGEDFDSSSEVRGHITTSTDGLHYGLDGRKSLYRDIVAFDEEGRVVDVVRADHGNQSADLDKPRGQKKKEIINAYIAGFPDAGLDAIMAVTDASEQYTQSILSDLHQDEFADAELMELRDETLQRRLGAEINQFDDGKFTGVEYTEVGSIPKQLAVAEEPNTVLMNSVVEPMSQEEVESHPVKDRIINAWVMAPDLSYQDIAELADSSNEYARQKVNKLNAGELPADEVSESINVGIQQTFGQTAHEMAEEGDIDFDDVDVSIKESLSELDYTESESEEEEAEPPSYGVPVKDVVFNLTQLDVDLDKDQMATVAGCSVEYVRRILNDIEDGDISPRDVEAASSEYIQGIALEFIEENEIVADDEEDDEAAEEVPTVTDMELEMATETIEGVPVKKDRLMNVWLADSEIGYQDAGDIASTSTEHARNIFNQIESGDITESDLEQARDQAVINAVEVKYQEMEGGPEVAATSTGQGTQTWSNGEDSESEEAVSASESDPAVEVTAEDDDGKVVLDIDPDELNDTEFIPASKIETLMVQMQAVERYTANTGQDEGNAAASQAIETIQEALDSRVKAE